MKGNAKKHQKWLKNWMAVLRVAPIAPCGARPGHPRETQSPNSFRDA